MLARFFVRVPFNIHVPMSTGEPEPYEELELAGLRVRIYPPFRSTLTASDFEPESGLVRSELPPKLVPRTSPPVDPWVTIGGEPAIRCDALRIDFQKASFDRSRMAEDPPIALAFQLANDWLQRLRQLAQAPEIRPLEQTQSLWRLEYLKDDGSEFEKSEEYVRRRLGTNINFSTAFLSSDLTEAVASLPVGYQVSAAESLLLDAYRTLPEVGPALVLAWTAVETRIAVALDRLAQLYGLPPALWTWINERGFFLKNPSVEEQYDSLLKAITRRSLKDERRLWEAFQNLNTARNRFVHTGVPTVGNNTVDSQRAFELISSARGIIDWVEALLPEADRRPAFASSVLSQTTIPLYAPEPQLSRPAGDEASSGPEGQPPA